MSHPLIGRLLNDFGYPLLDQTNLAEFLAENEFSVLFFTDDPARNKETPDVAVVLPELVALFPQLKAAVIDRSCEKQLQGTFGFAVWPALVFMKGQDYLGNIIRIQNWDDYCNMIPEILQRKPQTLNLNSLQGEAS